MRQETKFSKLILLPGLNGTGQLFSPLVRQLETHIDCEIIEYPEDRKFSSYLEMAEFVISKLPADGPIILLAESFSGPVGYQIGLQKIPQLKHLIFVATFLKSPAPLLKYILALLPLSLLKPRFIPDIATKHFCLGRQASDGEIREFWAVVSAMNPEIMRSRLKLAMSIRQPERTLDIPCTYIQASNDWLISKSHIDEFLRQCKNLEITALRGPHFILQAQPEKCADIVRELIDRN